MAQHLRDLGQRGAVPNHPDRQTVAEQVRDASRVRADTGPLEGEPHDVITGVTAPRAEG